VKKWEEQGKQERRSLSRGTLVIQVSLVEARRRYWLSPGSNMVGMLAPKYRVEPVFKV